MGPVQDDFTQDGDDARGERLFRETTEAQWARPAEQARA
jgi:hypothetical protein